MTRPDSHNADIFLYKPWKPKYFFQYEIIINVLISSSRFIWIPMFWVYCQYKYFNSFSAGIVFIRQNLTSSDVRFRPVKTIPALKELREWKRNSHWESESVTQTVKASLAPRGWIFRTKIMDILPLLRPFISADLLRNHISSCRSWTWDLSSGSQLSMWVSCL